MYVKLVFSIPVNNSYLYSVPEELKDHISIGQRVKVNFAHRDTYGFVVEICNKIENMDSIKIKSVDEIIDQYPLINDKNLKLAQWMSSFYYVSLGEVLKIMTPGSQKVKPYIFENKGHKKKDVKLTAKQSEIVNELKSLTLPDYSLIYGITGSGKTEIYLSLIEHFIKKKSKLYISSLKYLLPNN